MQNKKVLIAAGGTGGHLFPAQAFGDDLLQKEIEVRFCAAGLKTNRYFKKERFDFEEIMSSTPFRKKPLELIKAFYLLGKGIAKSFRVVQDFKPDIVVGFGSFHSFPVLFAALFLKIPIVLFEPNAIPGRVNRLFSRWAKLSAIQFGEAASGLQGKKAEVAVPLWQIEKNTTKEKAREYFSLSEKKFTILVFGGSQGASSINCHFGEAMQYLKGDFQVVHIVGKKDSAEEFRDLYQCMKVPACVKEFEDKMQLAWNAADLVICRSGAATVAEQIAYGVPAIFIPFPHAVDDHQTKNASFMVKIGGALLISEKELSAQRLSFVIDELISHKGKKLAEMKVAIDDFRQKHAKQDLSSVVRELLL